MFKGINVVSISVPAHPAMVSGDARHAKTRLAPSGRAARSESATGGVLPHIGARYRPTPAWAAIRVKESTMLRHLPSCVALVGCFSVLDAAHAHHSYSEYDDKQIVEIEGTLQRSALQNPHVHFFVQGTDKNGRPITWDLEAISLNWLQRTKVPLKMFEAGNRVKFAGWPSKRAPERIYALNMLAEDGQEILLFRTAAPRWASTTLGYGAEEAQSFYEGGVPNQEHTLFHVWASHLGNPENALSPTAPLALTESAKQAVAAFDPVNESTESGCTPKGMPRLMSQPPPMEFIDNGDTILMRMEEYDTVRTIHMTASAHPEVQPRTPLGYSVGRWDGETLVVETTRSNYPYLTATGVPQGPNARFVERFSSTSDGSRLNYSLVITDPDTLLAPAELKRIWVYRPGETVLPFSCKQ
jgi:hypothetical protein